MLDGKDTSLQSAAFEEHVAPRRVEILPSDRASKLGWMRLGKRLMHERFGFKTFNWVDDETRVEKPGRFGFT